MGKILAWCLFDFGTTVFMMNIVSLSFVQWLDQSFGHGDTKYGIISTIAYTLCLVLYPLSGQICDRGWKILPLALLNFISIGAVFCMGWCDQVVIGGLLFIAAYVPYQLALTFYNALLEDISTNKNMGVVSGLGVAFRYTGAIFGLFSIQFFIKAHPESLVANYLSFLLIQIPEPGQTVYLNAFIPTALMYFAFTLPLFLVIRSQRRTMLMDTPAKSLWKSMFHNIRIALQDANVRWLLLTILFSGIPLYAAVHFMSVFLEKIGGIPKSELVKFLMFATVFSILGGLGFGFSLRKLGNKLAFFVVMAIWVSNLFIGSFISGRTMMWVMGAFCGIGMGGYWAITRIMILDITPRGKQGEYLSMYWIVVVLCGICSSGLWPLCITLAEYLQIPCTPQRVSLFILSLIGLGGILTFLPVKFSTSLKPD